jgi:hypothetical protein
MCDSFLYAKVGEAYLLGTSFMEILNLATLIWQKYSHSFSKNPHMC